MIGEYIELNNGLKSKASFGVNGIELSAKNNIMQYSAVVISKNNVICNVKGKIAKSNYETEFDFENEKYVIKSIGQSNTIETVKKVGEFFKNAVEGSIKEAAMDFLPKIYDANNNLVGECRCGDDNVLHKIYTLFGKTYHAYHSSTNNNEFIYCIYDANEQLVAEVKKCSKISHGHARYTIYANNECFKEALLIGYCWALEFNKHDGGEGDYIKTNYKDTTFMNKYNQSFIDNIVQSVGAGNLPENMPLVNEYVVKASKSADVKLHYVVLAIVIIIFGIILFLCFK